MSSAFVGHDHSPVPRTPADPFQAEQTVAKRRSECTGQMWPPLAPVETCEGVSATPRASAGDVDPKSREAVLSIVRDGEPPVSRAEDALGDQRVRQCNSQLSSQVVVARPTRPELTVADGLTKRVDLPYRSEDCQSLHGSRHARISDPVELLAAHPLGRDQRTIRKVGEVTARRRGRHTGLPSELTGRVCPAIEQQVEHRRSGGIADQPGDGGHIEVVLHVSTLTELCRSYHLSQVGKEDRMEPIIATERCGHLDHVVAGDEAREVASPQHGGGPACITCTEKAGWLRGLREWQETCPCCFPECFPSGLPESVAG